MFRFFACYSADYTWKVFFAMININHKLTALRFIIAQKVQSIFFNMYINRKYLVGNGIEVGPGEHPFATAKNTIFLDYFVDGYDELFPNAKSHNYINARAEDIPAMDDSFDFVVSAHCLEHCVDPIKVLLEFRRVVKGSGVIVLILPHANRTFDKGRKFSNLEGHIEDYELGVTASHYLQTEGKYHDIFEEFLRISTQWPRHTWIDSVLNENGSWNKKKIIDRGIMHYHVWSQHEVIQLLEYIGCKINLVLEVMPGRFDSFIVSATVQK